MKIHVIDKAEKNILVNIRLRESEIKAIKENAARLTNGNVSSLLRYLGVNPNLRAKPKFKILKAYKPRKTKKELTT